MLTNPVPSLTISFALISGCTKRIPDFGLWDFTLLYTGWQYKKLIMNRKFQQWWLAIPTISAKRAITSHVKPLNWRKTPAYFVDIWHCELQFVKGSHKSQFVKCLFLHFPLLSLTDKILIRSLIWKRMAIIVEFQTWSEIMIAQVVTKKVNYIEDTLIIVYVHIHCVDRNIQRKWNYLFFKNVQGAITRTDPNINCTSSHVYVHSDVKSNK